MKFDEAARTFEISVRELAEGEGYARIGFERGEGWHRLGLGAELHARVLQERARLNPEYRREVFLQARWAVEDWTAIVTGRLDGCAAQTGGGWLVEEFKSTYVPTSEIRRTGGVAERHQRQLLLYCHLWARLGHSPVTGALVYVDLASGEETALAVPYDAEALERDVQRRLQRSLAIWKAEATARGKKAQAAAGMPFPHAAPRPGQQVMIDAVRKAVAGGGHLLAEAPTGSGKTAAALHPALAQGLAAGRQVVFLTSKTLQQKMAVAALRAMNVEGAFRTLQIRNKEKMCANDRVICHEDFCPYAKGYPEKMERSGLVERLRASHWHYDPDAVFAAAKMEKVCPFETQLELARSADAIVADYNYVFDPGAALRHLGPDELGEAILLIDEAHNLPDRARQIFSPEILEQDFRAAASRLLLQPGELFETLSESIDRMIQLLADEAAFLPAGAAIAEIDPPREALRAAWKEWEAKFIRYLSWKREAKYTPPDDPVVDAHFAWQRVIAALHLFGAGFSCVVERRPDGVRLAIICLDPARALAPIFRASASSILFSATLSPVELVRRTLGLQSERTETISLPPPFPRENRKVMILPQVRTTFAARESNFAIVAKLLAEMSDAQTGNGLVLFPSYQFLRRVAEKMPATRARVWVQRPNASPAERQEIFSALAAPPPQGVLVLAVLGGMYAEGVDYPGELLSGVYIVSPALPQVSFERELLRRYFDEKEQAGFEYAYLQPGMTRVIQAAGRLIRSETDRGVIALLCQRFVQAPYADHLPRDWYGESPAELITRDPAGEIRRFFGNRPGLSKI
ncbi:MAG TPA: ATP-dependent DNA helicase [Verrucomicrobiae bacterium]|nr:ATP-dependent DNA helicase [Verrucomicrobiae bacterium]